jgi:20S proteasome alpha/beta subunit
MIDNFDYSEEDIVQEDGSEMTPVALYAWCTRLMYHRRTKLNPLLTSIVVAGLENDEP